MSKMVDLDELEEKTRADYGIYAAFKADKNLEMCQRVLTIIAELRAARVCCEYLERILDTDAVRNENEELDGEASAVLAEWKKSTNGDG